MSTYPLDEYFRSSIAFLIAVQNYKTLPILDSPISDVEAIHSCIEKHGFDRNNIKTLIDPNCQELNAFINQMRSTVQIKDRVFVYFAGHGIGLNGFESPDGFLAATDSIKGDEQSFISMRAFAKVIGQLRCKHFLLILDCCFAGSFRWADKYRSYVRDASKKLYSEKLNWYLNKCTLVFQVITSASHDEEAIDKLLNIGAREHAGSVKHSPFAQILIDALNGGSKSSAFSDGIITATRLYSHIQDEFIAFLTQHNAKHTQRPNIFELQQHSKGEFIFLVPQTSQTSVGKLPKLEPNNPYKGLSSFEFTDADIFFGRKRVVKDLTEMINAAVTSELIMVTGPSGVGKTSTMNAGVLPALNFGTSNSDFKRIRPSDIRNSPSLPSDLSRKIENLILPEAIFLINLKKSLLSATMRSKTNGPSFSRQL